MRNEPLPAGLDRLQKLGIGAAIIGIIGIVAGFMNVDHFTGIEDPAAAAARFYQGYLFAFIVTVGLTFGCYGWLLLQSTVRGRWGFPVLRLLEAGSKMLVPMFILGIPLMFGLKYLYPWANPGIVRVDEVVAHKAKFWLTPAAFEVRYVLYFGVFYLVTWLLARSSRRQDETNNSAEAQFRMSLGAPMFVVFVVLVTFAMTDWVMSLDRRWFSTIFGFWFVNAEGIFALSFVALIITARSNRSVYTDNVVDNGVRRDLGNLILTSVMVWGYFTVSQFLIQWSGNLPEEIEYYLTRYQTGLWTIGTVIVVCEFFIPFVLLLSGRNKRTASHLQAIAAFLVLIRLTDVFWTVIPMFTHIAGTTGPGVDQFSRGPGLSLYWTDIAAVLALGGIWLAVFVWNLKQAPLLPQFVPVADNDQEALEHA